MLPTPLQPSYPKRPVRHHHGVLTLGSLAHWRWHRNRYDWVPGVYQRPPLGANRWIHGHWLQGHRGWFWIEGHWSD